MRGIQKCINWMLDNPMKILVTYGKYNGSNYRNVGGRKHRYNDNNDKFEWLDNDGEWLGLSHSLHIYKKCEWEPFEEHPVTELFDMITAYQDCENRNGAKYVTYHTGTCADGEMGMYSKSGAVYISNGSVYSGHLTNKVIKWRKVR